MQTLQKHRTLGTQCWGSSQGLGRAGAREGLELELPLLWAVGLCLWQAGWGGGWWLRASATCSSSARAFPENATTSSALESFLALLPLETLLWCSSSVLWVGEGRQEPIRFLTSIFLALGSSILVHSQRAGWEVEGFLGCLNHLRSWGTSCLESTWSWGIQTGTPLFPSVLLTPPHSPPASSGGSSSMI